ncbi:hypothetical protein K438DRAFT_1217980 [Mycena galopus ATCC 62051]|nr:hypothetical protein K438DRAFT_1217980 [Mycena galopus ATCC 62051]
MCRRLAEARNLYGDCTDDLPQMLEEAGFVEIRSELRMQVIGKWGGEIGSANGTNHVSVLRGMKTDPVLTGGRFGCVTSKAEDDELVDRLEKALDEIPGTGQKKFVVKYLDQKAESV